jgi:hypothetical protein
MNRPWEKTAATSTPGGRDRAKTIKTTANVVDLVIDQGPFCDEGWSEVAGHSRWTAEPFDAAH